MRSALSARFAGPTNHRGARVIVTATTGRTVVPWDHALNPSDNYVAAFRQVIKANGWDRERWHYGQLPDGTYVACCSSWSSDPGAPLAQEPASTT